MNKYFQLIDVDECQNSPCKNGGTCINIINGYRCECMNGASGKNCENGWYRSISSIFIHLESFEYKRAFAIN